MKFRISISPVGGNVICFEHERMRFWWVKTQLGSAGSIVVQCTSGFMIYETRDTVFYRDIRTPRREFKIQRAAEYFWQNSIAVVIFFVLSWRIMSLRLCYKNYLQAWIKRFSSALHEQNKKCKPCYACYKLTLTFILFSGVTVVCGYHSYWMDSRTSFIPAQSAAPSLVNIVALGSIVYGTRRRNIDKRNTITQEDNLARPHWILLKRDAWLAPFYIDCLLWWRTT